MFTGTELKQTGEYQDYLQKGGILSNEDFELVRSLKELYEANVSESSNELEKHTRLLREEAKEEVSIGEAMAYCMLRNRENLIKTEPELSIEDRRVETKCMSDRELLTCIFLITNLQKYYSMRTKFPNMFKSS